MHKHLRSDNKTVQIGYMLVAIMLSVVTHYVEQIVIIHFAKLEQHQQQKNHPEFCTVACR